MSQIIVSGEKKLEGTVRISGAKNAALPILAATVMIDEPVVIRNVPELRDINTMLSILQKIGKKVTFEHGVVQIEPGEILLGNVPYDLVGKMRASFNLFGPLVMACGWARVGKPGGCNIGQRPVDYHVEGLKRFGLKIVEEHGDVFGEIPAEFDSHVEYELPFKSVGATEQLMTTASLMEDSEIVIKNAAEEPEIVDLQNFLNKAGANVSGAGTDTIRIRGVKKLHGSEYSVIPDRIEAGTYLLAGVITRGNVIVENVIPDHLKALLDTLKKMGAEVTVSDNTVRVEVLNKLKPVKVSAEPYPGFPTDLQPIITAVLSTIEGDSIVEELVFENRFGYVDEMNRMGAHIKVKDRRAHIKGTRKLSGAEISAPDIRAAAALVIAGMAAEGETIVHNAGHIFRGYEKLKEKFNSIGAYLRVYPDEE
ncbi:UDP-N-acetylglucosamine 1-carboxyvinyltransferase [Kosmotoga arenicorallina S304]|uniref:UDP-N-acetylglucosamine 1-carboxyvinyltransferase n=1 Tax=Kosmotoga arenicorallina S304 TaxID=1453497 RepID=A0A182C8C4_9BACT|nr:UDP-N-acetylglucosamine 1-carboxyvinyltransferase [Kosmotoga arenicorallina]OAA31743.1 UDP-N-acetylglucosamine 1-carboxyvinyltransferase [Kosmotoga arenicorallina S304]